MRKALLFMSALVLLMTMALAGCSGQKTSTVTESSQTVTATTPAETSQSSSVNTYSDSSQTIVVNTNQEFIIALQANPTTGYDWQPVFDAGLISQVKKDYQQDDHSGQQLVGSGGTDLITFKALKAGDARITLTYYRSWETPKADDKVQVFNITIK
jgi:predicted secreted protein